MQSRGAMLRDLQLQQPDGLQAAPLYTAPWVDTAEAHSLNGLMQGLSGEWPCVPFGMANENLPAAWRTTNGWEDVFAHGYAAHHDWNIYSTSTGLAAYIDLPSTHPVRRLERQVTPTRQGILIDLWVHVRKVCRLPIGLHPVFKLPQTPKQMHLKIDGAESVWTHPETPAADPSPARPAGISSSLQTIQGVADELLDFSRLPRAELSETRLLVTGATGTVSLADSTTGVRTELRYDASQFPLLMLWISNRGRASAPWLNRHLAVGIEPICAAFDLGTTISANTNPLTVSGLDTAFDLIPKRVFHTQYSISVLSN